MKNIGNLKIRDIEEIFFTEKKVNALLRIGAIIMTFGCLILFAESFHKLIHEASGAGLSFGNVLRVCLSVFLFWPMSYVAIKGKGPKKWSPYSY
ncbi:hypothetical protein [Oleiphilus messinensis]|uniref:hypothetical protein n=1 Tax=Oleiphilus messinensis TaxID=141451 RepID=UPI000B3BA30B|nr:hypothetical protein [Oleiphilus messinensis]